MTLEFSRSNFAGWNTTYTLSNGTIELVITGDVGPRIIRFGFVGDVNEFCEVADDLGKTGGNEWRMYGGHRFWHAPEQAGRTDLPDNSPVEITEADGVIKIVQPVETATGLQKTLLIYMSDDNRVHVEHRLTNHSLWAIECAPWGISVMTTGGKAIMPMPPRIPHGEALLPANSLTLWTYTDMGDPRWTWGEKYIMLSQDVNATTPQKIGAEIKDGWAAYLRDGHLFVKCFDYQAGAPYPDSGCNFETFTNDFMLEMESLAPMQRIEPGATAVQHEDWFLFKDVPAVANDADVDEQVLPLIQQVMNLLEPEI